LDPIDERNQNDRATESGDVMQSFDTSFVQREEQVSYTKCNGPVLFLEVMMAIFVIIKVVELNNMDWVA
ncbi:TPA: hypothetical protein ACG3KH_004255, partial [Clostridioides difficile]